MSHTPNIFSTLLFITLRIATTVQTTAPQSESELLHVRYEQPNRHGEAYRRALLKSKTLGSWEGHVAKLTPCTSGSHLFSGSFFNTTNGEPVYEPQDCKLVRFSADEARQCLANKTILFVGDSLTRYQYLSLAYFLSHGVYPQRFGDDDAEKNVCLANQYPSWNDYYNITSNQLSFNSGNVSAQEVCNCFRPDKASNSLQYENRHCFIQQHGHVPTLTKLYFNCTFNWPSIDEAAFHAVDTGLAQLNPDAVYFNVGAWFRMQPERPAIISAAGFQRLFEIKEKLPNTTTRFMWRTMTQVQYHTNLRNVRRESQLLTALARYYDWEVLEAGFLSHQAHQQGLQLQVDGIHFMPAMYDQWNDLLLNMLCELREDGTSSAVPAPKQHGAASDKATKEPAGSRKPPQSNPPSDQPAPATAQQTTSDEGSSKAGSRRQHLTN